MPAVSGITIRRYQCQICRCVVVVVPAEVLPRRLYPANAVALALAMFGVLRQAARAIRARIIPWRIVGAGATGWATAPTGACGQGGEPVVLRAIRAFDVARVESRRAGGDDGGGARTALGCHPSDHRRGVHGSRARSVRGASRSGPARRLPPTKISAARLSYCHNATLGRRDFYRQLCQALGLAPSATAAAVFYAVSTHVEDLGRERMHPIFLLDEAHLLHQDTLEHLHILLNYEWDRRALLSLVLVGLPELHDRLGSRRSRHN